MVLNPQFRLNADADSTWKSYNNTEKVVQACENGCQWQRLQIGGTQERGSSLHC